MNILLNTNLVRLFSGTYENIWEVQEYADNGDELEVDYDFKDLVKSIVKAYKNHEAYILSELNISFIKKIRFTGAFYNPSEYNFATDEIDFKLTIDKKQLVKTLKSLEYNKAFDQYLKDSFTSCDGFISFTPNNYKELASNILEHGDEFDQSIGALITYLVGFGKLREIESDIYEDWSGNGYEGLDYKIV